MAIRVYFKLGPNQAHAEHHQPHLHIGLYRLPPCSSRYDPQRCTTEYLEITSPTKSASVRSSTPNIMLNSGVNRVPYVTLTYNGSLQLRYLCNSIVQIIPILERWMYISRSYLRWPQSFLYTWLLTPTPFCSAHAPVPYLFSYLVYQLLGRGFLALKKPTWYISSIAPSWIVSSIPLCQQQVLCNMCSPNAKVFKENKDRFEVHQLANSSVHLSCLQGALKILVFFFWFWMCLEICSQSF